MPGEAGSRSCSRTSGSPSRFSARPWRRLLQALAAAAAVGVESDRPAGRGCPPRRSCRPQLRRAAAQQCLSNAAACGAGRGPRMPGLAERCPPLSAQSFALGGRKNPRSRGLPRGAGVRGASAGSLVRGARRPATPALEAQLERPDGTAPAPRGGGHRVAGRPGGRRGRGRRCPRRGDDRLVGGSEGARRGGDVPPDPPLQDGRPVAIWYSPGDRYRRGSVEARRGCSSAGEIWHRAARRAISPGCARSMPRGAAACRSTTCSR